jgi:hypothetical protein
MSRLDNLLAERCPDGAEFCTLGNEISSLRTGLNPLYSFAATLTPNPAPDPQGVEPPGSGTTSTQLIYVSMA